MLTNQHNKDKKITPSIIFLGLIIVSMSVGIAPIMISLPVHTEMYCFGLAGIFYLLAMIYGDYAEVSISSIKNEVKSLKSYLIKTKV